MRINVGLGETDYKTWKKSPDGELYIVHTLIIKSTKIDVPP
jgi:hypothetical protein